MLSTTWAQPRYSIAPSTATSPTRAAALATYNHGTTTLTDCTVSGNSASANGGGLNTEHHGTTTLIDCTVSGNSAAGTAAAWTRVQQYNHAARLHRQRQLRFRERRRSDTEEDSATTLTNAPSAATPPAGTGAACTRPAAARPRRPTSPSAATPPAATAAAFITAWHGDGRQHYRGGEHGRRQRARRIRNVRLAGQQPDRRDRRQLRLGRLRPDRHHRPAAQPPAGAIGQLRRPDPDDGPAARQPGHRRGQ